MSIKHRSSKIEYIVRFSGETLGQAIYPVKQNQGYSDAGNPVCPIAVRAQNKFPCHIAPEQ